MSMSAHVVIMRRQDRQDDTTEELPEKFSKTHLPVTCPYATKTDSNDVTNQPELKAREIVGIHET